VRGIDTVAHVRPDSPALAVAKERFSALGATVSVSEWTAGAIDEMVAQASPDLVFSLLGTTRKRAKREHITGDIYAKVEVKLTAMLLDAACRAAPHARFVLLSSLGAGEGAKGGYLEARASMEHRVRGSGLAHTIARPSLVSGPDREEFRLGERVAARIADALLGVGGRRLRQRFHSITAQRLAQTLVTAALDPTCENRVLESEELSDGYAG
jgi:nucleoside-diphosphate-sugar epimerase